MIVVGVTKAVGDQLGKGGIADRMIWFNGFPFLDNKEEHSFGVPTSQVMTSSVTMIPATGKSVQEVQTLLNETKFSGFPVVEDESSKILVGYIGRTELSYAMERAKKQGMLSPQTKCIFTPPEPADEPVTPFAEPPVTFDSMSLPTVDFSTYVDSTPITVHPRLPLETAMELFKKMGPRVILVEHHGVLEGLVSVKDCLKYMFRVESVAHAASRRDEGNGQGAERIRDVIAHVGDWFAEKLNNLSRGRLKLKLNPRTAGGREGWSRVPNRVPDAPRPGDEAEDYRNERDILDGTEEFVIDDDGDLGVEMDVR
jgi:chloride channel 3/4/5